jgi:release factor glutamine methyltransferase
MNVNSKPLAPTIKQWLEHTKGVLSNAGIPSAQLDAELLLADVLDKDRVWLIAHGDEMLSETDLLTLEKNVLRRTKREPLAYIRGYKEFYGRNFSVTPDSLIPRPETETLIEQVLALPLSAEPVIHDVGSGSGCIPITLSLELPGAKVSGSDISHTALEIARRNAARLDANQVSFYKDNLLDRSSETFDVITANLPYVDPSWETSPETIHEPTLALFAEDQGLELIKKLIMQAETRLIKGGFLVLEADPRQHETIVPFALNYSFKSYQINDFIVVLQKD